MNKYETVAFESDDQRHSNNSVGRDRMTIASFTVPERLESKVLERVQERLGAVGVVSYTIELAGAGEPVLDLEGNSYVGEDEIVAAVDILSAERL